MTRIQKGNINHLRVISQLNGRIFLDLHDKAQFPEWYYRETLRSKMQKDTDPLILLARRNGLVGSALAYEHKDDTVRLFTLGVMPGHRHSGIGSTLLDIVEQFADNKGKDISTAVLEDYTPFMNMLISRGYIKLRVDQFQEDYYQYHFRRYQNALAGRL